MRTIFALLLVYCSTTCIRAQDQYEDIAGFFELDSVTVYAVQKGFLDPVNFIRITMEDTTLFYGFSLLKLFPHKMEMESKVYDKKGRLMGEKKKMYEQHIRERCRTQESFTLDSTGKFFYKKNDPVSETLAMMEQIFTTPDKVCNIQPGKVPKGLLVLDKPRDVRQQRELIKRFIFAPHTLRVEVPFFGSKMKTNIFEQPTAGYYQFRVQAGFTDNGEQVYYFDIEVDSVRHPDWEKNVLIKKMHTTFRAADLAILARSYELYYPGMMAACNLNISITMEETDHYLVPNNIYYQGRWKFPTKGTDHADIHINFYQITTHECTH